MHCPVQFPCNYSHLQPTYPRSAMRDKGYTIGSSIVQLNANINTIHCILGVFTPQAQDHSFSTQSVQCPIPNTTAGNQECICVPLGKAYVLHDQVLCFIPFSHVLLQPESAVFPGPVSHSHRLNALGSSSSNRQPAHLTCQHICTCCVGMCQMYSHIGHDTPTSRKTKRHQHR